MTIEVKVPVLPESVADATVLNWHKKVGEAVSRDENLVDLETDKVVLEVPCPTAGVIKSISKNSGETVVAEEILAVIEEAATATSSTTAEKAPERADSKASPSVRRLIQEHGLDENAIKGSGKGGRITKQDVMDMLEGQPKNDTASKASSSAIEPTVIGERVEKRVPMTRLRARIAERLVQAQQEAAMLTTFNEINLKNVMEIRSKYKDEFEKKYGIKLGFMSFFTKACIEALKQFPSVNASIDGQDVIYHGYYDVGIAVSTERGLVVPVIRNADQLSLAQIEGAIMDSASRARDNKLALEEMTGGTFTITNGGVFGSLISTPIINPPQTGILGMHKIEQRPVVENGEIVVRPMMYVAFSYDHRLIDGKESVQFLAMVKHLLEDPSRILLAL